MIHSLLHKRDFGEDVICQEVHQLRRSWVKFCAAMLNCWNPSCILPASFAVDNYISDWFFTFYLRYYGVPSPHYQVLITTFRYCMS
jgi:hypothetical protein